MSRNGSKRTGRPPLEIDPTAVEDLAAIMCTTAEIAAVLHCSKDTLERRFAAAIENGRERGKESLRRAQFKAALAGNPTMLIWLGKQHLEQRDRYDHEHTGKDGEPLVTVDLVRQILGASEGNGATPSLH